MASKNKNVLSKQSTTSKAFNYSYGNVRLDFSLRTDIKTELTDFLKILKEAAKDVEEVLNQQ